MGTTTTLTAEKEKIFNIFPLLSLPLPSSTTSASPGTTASTKPRRGGPQQVAIIKKKKKKKKKVFAENRCGKRFVFLHPVQKFVRFPHTSSLSRRWTRGALKEAKIEEEGGGKV